MKHRILKKSFAFSLAEVLVVVGLIGVVASLTLPNLNRSTSDKEMVARYMKLYAELTTAAGSAVAKYGPISSWIVNASTDAEKSTIVATRLLQYMKVSKVCGIDNDRTSGKCGNTGAVNRLDGTTSGGMYTDFNTNDYKVILANGANGSIQGYGNPSCEFDIDTKNNGVYTTGKDYFGFVIDGNTGEVKPYGWDKTESEMLSDCFQTGFSCGMWITRTGNMDYLKANRSGKCPNNTQLSWTVTSCK